MAAWNWERERERVRGTEGVETGDGSNTHLLLVAGLGVLGVEEAHAFGAMEVALVRLTLLLPVGNEGGLAGKLELALAAPDGRHEDGHRCGG